MEPKKIFFPLSSKIEIPSDEKNNKTNYIIQ